MHLHALMHRARPRLLLLAALAGSLLSASAQSWVNGGGGGEVRWSRRVNWDTAVPVNDGTANLIFGAVSLNGYDPNMDANWSINSLTFGSAATNTYRLFSSGGYTLTIGAGGLTNNSSVLQIISNRVATATNQTWAANNGDLSILLGITNNFTLTLLSAAGRTMNLSAISGTGGLTKTGAGTAVLLESSTFTGPVLIKAGTLIGSNNAPASGDGVFGNSAGGNLLLGDTTGTNAATLLMADGFTNSRAITVQAGSTGAKSVGLWGSGSARFGDIVLADDLTLQAGTGQTVNLAGVISQSGGSRSVTKTGAGAAVLLGTNTFTGTLAVNAGTLLLGAANRVENSVSVTLAGGTLGTGGYSETLGALTLSASSSIDYGAGASVLRFSASAGAAWNGTSVLNISNWSGVDSGGGTDQLFFGNSASGLTGDQLADVYFINPGGRSPGIWPAKMLSTGEVVPVPEPATVLTACALLGMSAWRERKRLRECLAKFCA